MKQDDQSTQTPSLVAFQSLLDSSPSSKEQTVELSALRRLAARGIPSEPPHLRPITYSLLLGVLGKQKSSWDRERGTGRDKYAQFAEKFLKEVEDSPSPSHPLSANDKLLDSISKDVHRTQTHLNFFSQPISLPKRDSTRSSSESHSLKHRRALANRFDDIQSAVWLSEDDSTQTGRGKPDLAAISSNEPVERTVRQDGSETLINSSPSDSNYSIRTNDRNQSIRSSSDNSSFSTNSLALPELPPLDFSNLSLTSKEQSNKEDNSTTPTSISNPAPSASLPSIAELHSDALTRILYIFALIHPHLAYTQGFAEILAPLYFVYASASVAEAKAEESTGEYRQAAVEGDTFWAFVGLMAEVGNVVKGPGEGVWNQDLVVIGGVVERDVKWALKRLSNRVKWADLALWEELNHKSLDPALPYYSFKWVSTLLAQDIPMESLLRIWDLILSEPPTTRTETPKIDLLLDVCTAMLLLARKPLIQAGRRRSDQSAGLWGDTDEQNGDFGEGFVGGMALLQKYPLSRIGLNNLIELAQESRQRRLLADLNGDGPDDETLDTLGSLPVSSMSSFASRLFRSSHQPSLSISSVPEEASVGDVSDDVLSTSTSSQSSRYSLMLKKVEAFKESDTAAALSKRSSNLTAAALSRWEDYNKPLRLEPVPEDGHTPDHPPPPPPKSSNRSSWTAKLWGSSQPQPQLLSSSVLNNYIDNPSKDPRPTDSLEEPLTVSNESITPSSSHSGELSAHLIATPTKVVLTPNKSLQDRLAAKLSTPATVTPDRTPISSPSVSHSSQKPLLLSSSARPPVSNSPHGYSPVSMSRQSYSESSSSVLSPLSTSGSSSPPPSFASRQPVSPYGSESESGSSRVPIGSRRSFSGSVGSDYSQPKTSFLKTSAKSQMSGIKLREKSSVVVGTGPGTGTNGTSDDHFTRPPTRSPRSRALASRTRSSASSYAGSDSDSMVAPPRSTSRLSTLSSGEESQRGWTLVDGDSGQSPSNVTQAEDHTSERPRESSSEIDPVGGSSETAMLAGLGRPLNLSSVEVAPVLDVRLERAAGPSLTKPTVGLEGGSMSSVGTTAVKPGIITTNLPSSNTRTQHTPVGVFGTSVSAVNSPTMMTPSSSPLVNQPLPFQHYRVRSTSSNGSSPVAGPRGPRKVSTSNVTIGGSGGAHPGSRPSPAVKVKQTRPTSIVSNTTDADDEGSIVGDGPGYDDLLDGYSQNDDSAVDLEVAARKARRANMF